VVKSNPPNEVNCSSIEICIHPFKINPVLYAQLITVQHTPLRCLLFELCSHLHYGSFNCRLYHTLFSTFVDYWHLPDKKCRG